MIEEKNCEGCKHRTHFDHTMTGAQRCRGTAGVCRGYDKWEPIDYEEIDVDALNTQIAGQHHKVMAIQPMEYSMKNNLNACQHTAIKYISQYKDKNGIEDLFKAIHTLEMLIEFEQEVLNGD